jgi:hypothetical protein
MITVVRENDKTMRVNVLPAKSGDSENPALTTSSMPERLEIDRRGRTA